VCWLCLTDPRTARCCAATSAQGCGDFAGQHNIVYKRSIDGGKTFGPLIVLADPGEMWPTQCPNKTASSGTMSCEFWDPTPFVDVHTGNLFVMSTRSWPHDGLTTVQSRMDAEMDCWLWTSTDLGATWSPPRNITSMIWSDKWKVGTPVNGHAIQTRTGRLLMPVYVRAGTDSSSFSGTFYSDDHGDTWAFANTSLVGPGTSESDLVQLQRTPNTLMFNHRGGAASGAGHVRYTSYSTDDGMSVSRTV
jgi:sialidase-1